MADMGIYGAHVHTEKTQVPEGQEERKGGAVNFKEPFVKSLLKFINKKRGHSKPFQK